MAENYEMIEGIKVSEFQPLPHHVMMRWLKKEETKGGILIPQNRQRSGFMKGIILALGPNCNPDLKVGQTVQFNGLTEKEFIGPQDPHDRDTVFLFTDECIFGIIDYDVHGIPKVKAVGSWIYVKPDVKADEAGLVLPEQVKDSMRRQSWAWQGEVVSAGNYADSCIDGDRIAYETQASTGVRLGDHNGEPCVVIQNEDVVGIMEIA